MRNEEVLFLIVIISAAMITVATKKLNVTGALTGAIVAYLLFLGTGAAGVVMLAVFFILGTVATSWKVAAKEKLGLAEVNKGKRTAAQVLANGGVAAATAFMAYKWNDHAPLFRLMMSASLAAATADTLSSELGNVYGKRYYNIISLRQDKRGENGVVSLEGSLFGLAGCSIIAMMYGVAFQWDEKLLYVIIAGTAGNIVDSVLGATVERSGHINNNGVNLLNTLTGAFTALLLAVVFD